MITNIKINYVHKQKTIEKYKNWKTKFYIFIAYVTNKPMQWHSPNVVLNIKTQYKELNLVTTLVYLMACGYYQHPIIY